MNDTPIQIRNPEVVRALREIASQRGQPITQAVGDLAKAELEKLAAEKHARVQQKLAAIRETVEKLHKLPIVGSPLTDDDLYDEDGLPK